MRSVALVLALLCSWYGIAAPAPRRAPPEPQGWLDLAQWGAAHGLGTRILGKGLQLELAGRSTQLSFSADSMRFVFDGTEIRLGTPIRRVGDRFLMAQRDLQTTLQPLLSPPKRPANHPILRVAINAGHGGKDPGNIEGRRQEKHYTLLLAGEARRALERAGLRVVMIRQDDTFVELEDRAGKANRAKADLYVSLHFNAVQGAGSREVHGVETYCLTPAGASSTNDSGHHGGAWHVGNRFDRDNIVLARMIHRAVANGAELEDRGVRRARFKELTLLDMPGVLVEGGYMTNPDDGRGIYTPEGRTQLARAIVDGILAYKRLVERGGAE
jgi:N-acetylmuramoyl-L-alanine amidase